MSSVAAFAMERIPEPELMEEPEQARAYAEADFSSSDAAMVEAVLALIADRACPPSRLVDLGCGPGNISFLLAEALPLVPVLALDGAEAMLSPGRERQRRHPRRWPLLRFEQAILPLADGALDAVPEAFRAPFPLLVSNSLLHHLHDPQALWSGLRQLGAPGSLVLIRDLRRPDNVEQLEALVMRHASGCPAVLRRDYRASLQAAFRPEEVELQLRQAGLAGLLVRPCEDRYLEVLGQLD